MKLRHLRVTQDHLLGEIVIYRNEIARAETDAALRELRESELAEASVAEAENNNDPMEAP
jgi:hypothetical protein